MSALLTDNENEWIEYVHMWLHDFELHSYNYLMINLYEIARV